MTLFIFSLSHSRITARTHLENPGIYSQPGGAFEVSARTSNSPIYLTFPTSPQISYLKLDARTSNANAAVDLNSAFEGMWSVVTSEDVGVPNILPRTDSIDPTGRGRRRTNFVSRL